MSKAETLLDPVVAELQSGVRRDRIIAQHINPLDPTDGAYAIRDAFPRFPYQVVIFPFRGRPGEDYTIDDLPPSQYLRLTLMARAVGEHISRFGGVLESKPPQRALMHAEGFAIRDHPHILRYVAARSQGRRLYEGPAPAGDPAHATTLALPPLSQDLAVPLENRLQFLDRMANPLNDDDLSFRQMLSQAHLLSAPISVPDFIRTEY